MKQIAFISGIQIFPALSGGQVRSASICLALSKLGHKINIYSFTGRKEDYISFKKSESQIINENIVEFIDRSWFFGVLQFLFYRIKLPPFWLTIINSLFLPKKITKILQSSDFVIIDSPFLYRIKKYTSKVCYLNTQNVEADLWKHNKLLYKLVSKIELNGVKFSDNIIFCCESNRKFFSDIYPPTSQKSVNIPNGINLDLFKQNDDVKFKTRAIHGISNETIVILFTGSQYHPNQEAYQFLKSFSHENKEFLLNNKILFLIVGSVSAEPINEEYFKVVGKTPEIIPYFFASDFGINPVIQGSGVNVKMIEYMAAKLPILSSEFGTRDLRLENKKSFIQFQRSTLLEQLYYAINMNTEDKHKMTKLAYDSNINSIDISHSINKIFIERITK